MILETRRLNKNVRRTDHLKLHLARRQVGPNQESNFPFGSHFLRGLMQNSSGAPSDKNSRQYDRDENRSDNRPEPQLPISSHCSSWRIDNYNPIELGRVPCRKRSISISHENASLSAHSCQPGLCRLVDIVCHRLQSSTRREKVMRYSLVFSANRAIFRKVEGGSSATRKRGSGKLRL